MKKVGSKLNRAKRVKKITKIIVATKEAINAALRCGVWLALVAVRVTIALITCSADEISKPMSWMVIPKLAETAPVMLLIREISPLIISALLSRRTLSDPYFRKLLPEIPATAKFRTVIKIRFSRIIAFVDNISGLGRLREKNTKIAAVRRNIGSKPILFGVWMFSNRQNCLKTAF